MRRIFLFFLFCWVVTGVGIALGGEFDEPGIAADDPAIVAWATGYLDYFRADGETAYADPTLALGAPTGGIFDVVSLGDVDPADDTAPVGRITLTFDAPIADREGADFAVFENAFGQSYPDAVYAEFAFVEVSTDGETFARFPATAEVGEPGDYGFMDVSGCHNLAGKHLIGTGTPFDLAELSETPEVAGGAVDVADIHYIRIVDIPGYGETDGQTGYRDAAGRPIYDNWPTFGSGGFDLDAVAVLGEAGADDDEADDDDDSAGADDDAASETGGGDGGACGA